MSLLITHQTLKELFPQVDDRLLKAAALEHGHEVEFAIEFVVEEVLPRISFNEHTNGLNGSCFATGDELASSAENQETNFTLESHEDFPTLTHANATMMCDSSVALSEDASAIPVYKIESHEDFPTLATASRFPDPSIDMVEEFSAAPGLASAECSACSSPAENCPNLVQDTISKIVGISDLSADMDELLVPFESKVNASNIDDNEPWKQKSDDALESLISDEKLPMGTADPPSMSADGQTCQTTVDVLEDLINEARKNKYAGEVYGEKSILATEARELQSRLGHLSDKRDKYLSIIGELNRDLQGRIAAASAAKAEAESQKLKKKEFASKVLAQEQVIMEQVTEDSKKLNQQAEKTLSCVDF